MHWKPRGKAGEFGSSLAGEKTTNAQVFPAPLRIALSITYSWRGVPYSECYWEIDIHLSRNRRPSAPTCAETITDDTLAAISVKTRSSINKRYSQRGKSAFARPENSRRCSSEWHPGISVMARQLSKKENRSVEANV